jgi:hypothetical protein
MRVIHKLLHFDIEFREADLQRMVLFTTKDPFSPAALSRADLAAGDPACFPAHHTVR